MATNNAADIEITAGGGHEYTFPSADTTLVGQETTDTLKNKDLTDASNTFPTLNQDTTGNAATATALETARTIAGHSFDGSANITISASDVSAIPSSDAPSGDIVGTTDTQTLSGKTLTKPTINGSVPAVTADTDGSTVTFDLSASNIHTVTLGGNRTLALSNASTGQVFMIELTQDSTGSRTVTWFSTIHWAGGTAPTLTTTASKKDVFGFRCTGTDTYDGYVIGQNI